MAQLSKKQETVYVPKLHRIIIPNTKSDLEIGSAQEFKESASHKTDPSNVMSLGSFSTESGLGLEITEKQLRFDQVLLVMEYVP